MMHRKHRRKGPLRRAPRTPRSGAQIDNPSFAARAPRPRWFPTILPRPHRRIPDLAAVPARYLRKGKGQ